MNVDKLTLRKIFDTTERLEAPLFQRPYVWSKINNWVPLWESIQSVTEKRIAKLPLRPHFLGTIVLDQLRTLTGRIPARQIIDGQQRLTTLQLALAAARDLCRAYGQEQYARAFAKLTDNDVPLSDSFDDTFKVWPTNADRTDFRDVMSAGSPDKVRKLPHSDPYDAWLIPDAYLFFSDTFREWLGGADQDGFAARLDALHTTLRDDLHVVVIDLEEKDDAQEIFETLNALGTPLLPADLVKNFLFHLAETQQHDTPKLYTMYWESFDTDKGYWRSDKRMGRLKRPRIDVFLYFYLTLMTADDILASQLFSAFRKFAASTNDQCAAKHMQLFKDYSSVYRSIEHLSADSREELFIYRLEQMDTSTVFPVLLEVFKRFNNPQGYTELLKVLVDLESFFVRRMVCEETPKNYNRFFVDMIREARDKDDFSAAGIRAFLLKQTVDMSRWPNDEEFKQAWMTIPFYKRLKQARTRMVLEALERGLYDEKTEKIKIDRALTIEHVLPQSWERDWPLHYDNAVSGAGEAAEKRRWESIHRIGNLTLLTNKLNPLVSNGPWSDKRKALNEHASLTLNRELHLCDNWNETLIEERSAHLFDIALKIWPYPKSS
jgi:uncharacterized protein with ParB-like and HNH nuclease domain